MAEKHQKELGGRNMSTGMRVIVGIFAVVMALSMMLPSLAPIFAGDSSSQEESEQTDESTDDKNAEDEKKEAEQAQEPAAEGNSELDAIIAKVPENDTLKSLAEQYEKNNETFVKRLEEDPNNLAALLNLGQNYMSWGNSASHSGTTDEEKSYSDALLKKAIEYFDRYLALRDSDAVKIQRTLCDYYLGNTDEAIQVLTTMTEEKPDYPLAWAYLGMLYEQQYQNDEAKAAYAKAAEADPNDEYGVKSYAEERTNAINSSQVSASDLTNEDVLGTSSTPAEGLAGTIAQESGL